MYFSVDESSLQDVSVTVGLIGLSHDRKNVLEDSPYLCLSVCGQEFYSDPPQAENSLMLWYNASM